MGNLFATMVGALIGILIALEINRQQEETQDRKEAEVRENEEQNRKSKILKLLKGELEYNRQLLSERQSSKGDEKTRNVSLPKLKDELWNAFSDGGELQWVKDLQLLDFIATAYYHIRTIIFLEDKYFEAVHYPGMVVKQEKYPKDYILGYLTSLDPDVLKHIEVALGEIEKSLGTFRKV